MMNYCCLKIITVHIVGIRINQGGGILIYVLNTLIHKLWADLEIYWDECIWIEVEVNNERYLVGLFYSPKTSDKISLTFYKYQF